MLPITPRRDGAKTGDRTRTYRLPCDRARPAHCPGWSGLGNSNPHLGSGAPECFLLHQSRKGKRLVAASFPWDYLAIPARKMERPTGIEPVPGGWEPPDATDTPGPLFDLGLNSTIQPKSKIKSLFSFQRSSGLYGPSWWMGLDSNQPVSALPRAVLQTAWAA